MLNNFPIRKADDMSGIFEGVVYCMERKNKLEVVDAKIPASSIRRMVLAGFMLFLALTVDSHGNGFKTCELKVLKTEGFVYIRSPFSADEDLVVRVGFGRNNQVNFRNTYLVKKETPMSSGELNSGRLIHANGDDTVAWRISDTYIGGNHGCSDGREIVTKGHGLSSKDTGSQWLDEEGRNYFLIKVLDGKSIVFLGANSGKGGFWKFERRIAGKIFKRVSDGATVEAIEWKVFQVRPALRIKKQEYLVNGTTPIEENKVVSCSRFDIVEQYDIVNPGSLLADIAANPGQERNFVADHLDAVVSDSITYRFFPNGANVVYYRSRALQDFQFRLFLGVMNAPLYMGQYHFRHYYVPRTLPFTAGDDRFDFQNMQNIPSRLKVPLNFTIKDGNISDPQNPPDRFIQFMGTGEGGNISREVGFALGYSPIHGMSVPSERIKNTDRFLQIYSTAKTYPAAADSRMGNVEKGKEFYFVGYRQYFNPKLAGSATCFYWNRQEDDDVFYLDYHKTVKKDLVKLPDEFTGRKIEVIDKTPSVTLHTSEEVPDKGIEVSVEGKYGYIVFKVN